MGLGLGFTTVIASSQTKGVTNEDGKESGITTGYVLKDNDPGDLFSVDVAMDDLNKTPFSAPRSVSLPVLGNRTRPTATPVSSSFAMATAQR